MTPFLADADCTLWHGDALDVLRNMEAESVDCVVTSPPYWGLRDYGTGQWEGGDEDCDHDERQRRRNSESQPGTGNAGRVLRDGVPPHECSCGARRVDSQLGLEPTPDAYVARMVAVFREVRRVLAPHGTCWVNLGDSYAAGGGFAPDAPSNQARLRGEAVGAFHGNAAEGHMARATGAKKPPPGLKQKDLVGIPWRVAFALQQDGWCLRSDVVWSKPNPMPESVTDRPTKAHEMVFLLTKAEWKGAPRGRFCDLSEDDKRWLALLLDTEGNVCVKRVKPTEGKSPQYGAQVAIGSTSRTLLDRVQQIVGEGNVNERAGTNAPMFYWQVSNKVARDLLYAVYPYLIVKPRQARIAIHLESLLYHRGKATRRTDAENAALESLWLRNKECNQFGEPDLSDVPAPKYGRWVPNRYFFDQEAVREPHTPASLARYEYGGSGANGKPYAMQESPRGHEAGRNVRSVWTIATQPYPEAHFACVDDETQALTTQGWRYHHELEDGDTIGAYDPKTGRVRFLRSTFHRYPYDGELVAIEKRDTSQRLTPNHRCVVRPRDGDEMVILAEELMPRMDVRLAAPLECAYFGKPLGDYAALVGWYIAEGWRRSDGKAIYLSQSESANPRSVGLIRELLLAVNADFTERRRERQHLAVTSVEIEWAVYGDVAARLRELAPEKRMTSSLALLGDDDAERLLHALVAGDGHVRSDGRIVIIQKDRESIEFMQMLAMRCGYRAHLSQRADGIYTLYLTRGEWLTLRSTNGAHVPIPREHYVGTVWCPNTPTGFWLARRDGKPFVTGNTYPEELVRRCVLAGCPVRVCRTCGKPSERVVEKPGGSFHEHEHDAEQGHNQNGSERKRRYNESLEKPRGTVGWSDCGHNDWRPGVVLDPFVGSGTTCKVARDHGRHSVGIDLSSDYLALAARRLQQLSLLTG